MQFASYARGRFCSSRVRRAGSFAVRELDELVVLCFARRADYLQRRELGGLPVEVSRLTRAGSFAPWQVLCRVAVHADRVTTLR